MNKIKKHFPVFFKWLIVALAAGNLIFLFVFNYQLPGFIRLPFAGSDADGSDTSSQTSSESTDVDTSTDTNTATLQIVVPEGTLTYDGTGTLNLMDGISVTDASGNEQTDIQVFSTIKAGDSWREKIIEYSVTDTSGNRSTAQRPLQLGENYTGPTIEIRGDIPDLRAEDLPVLVSLLIDKNLLYANDGFGQDISGAVTSSVESSADASGNTTVTLSLTNMVNDSYSIDVTVHTGATSGPVMKLTTNNVVLNVGAAFSFYDYIQTAQDEDGNDLYSRITVNGAVDTSTPGTYTLEIFCTDTEGNKSNTETLTVTVR